MTFAEAFRKARKEQGPGGVFTYKGKKYTTDRADDKTKTTNTTKNNVEKKTDDTKKKETVTLPVKKPTKKKETTETTKKGDDDKSLLSFLPSNLRMFAYDLAGGKEGLTENDLSERQLEDLRQTVLNSVDRIGVEDNLLDGVIDYEDYNTQLGNAYTSGLSKYLSPAFHNKTTFGKMNYDIDADGNVILTDEFDFADAASKKNDPLLKKFARIANAYSNSSSFGGGIYNALRETSGNFGSAEGEGAKSVINLGNLNFSEDELAGIMATKAAKDIA